ncbi:hypothetical protein DPMN_084045 [Dreissena polymorpha]|uniref:Uncharacterized protein n=1 Tax=Dreissena polymorpha TaxID=45954 RepID=A0A9D3YDL8_DREPO|nr:hypothetical protein DPMN_084045 [Dreissena polymorpha]
MWTRFTCLGCHPEKTGPQNLAPEQTAQGGLKLHWPQWHETNFRLKGCQEENYKLESKECRNLKDELDDLRHTAEQSHRLMVKLLEDKNTKYMQENLELQESPKLQEILTSPQSPEVVME